MRRMEDINEKIFQKFEQKDNRRKKVRKLQDQFKRSYINYESREGKTENGG